MANGNGENDKDKKKKKSSRVYKNEADKKRQEAMEGKDTPFQNQLRAAEKAGKKSFMYTDPKTGEKKLIATRTFEPEKPVRRESIAPAKRKSPDTSTKEPKMDAPKKVYIGKTDPKLAKDITGKPSYLKRNKSSERGVARRLKKRRRQRGY